MKIESDPIADDEWLLRRIHISHVHDGQIGEIAFKPRVKGRDPDTNGISLYRLSCLRSLLDILTIVPDEKRGLAGIVQIPVSLIRSLGLTVKSDPDPRVAGHVVISELSSDKYLTDSHQVTVWCSQLALAASKPSNILLCPTPQAP